MKSKTIIVKVRPEKREEFQQAILSLQKHRKDGNSRRIFIIIPDSEDQNVYHLTYMWKSKKESESYYKSEDFRILVGALKTLCVKSEWK
jgi:hypothetical protein